MDISSLSSQQAMQNAQVAHGANQAKLLDDPNGESSELRKKFDSFVGESFYGQMLHEMRKTVGKSAYFNGGRGEEVFRGQLDQVIATKLAESNAKDFTGPMFRLFSLTRS